MLKLTTAAAILALASLPFTALAATTADGAFQVANIAPPEEPEPPATTPPAETPPADPNAPTVNDAPPADPAATPAPAENPIDPTSIPDAVEGGTPSTEPAPEVPDAAAAAETTDAAATAETPPAEASSGGNMGTIIGVIAFLAVAAGAGYWFMNRKA